MMCRLRSSVGCLLRSSVALSIVLAAASAAGGPYGTSYSASVDNLPGTAAASLSFDGLATPLGSSGLIVGEKSTPIGPYGLELVEFSLRTADGEPFVGQQLSPKAPASVDIASLQWLDDPMPAVAAADSGYAWLSIDGVPQALSDYASLDLIFGTHPLDPSIQIMFINNVQTPSLGFDSAGESAFEAFAALVGPILAADIDGVNFGVAVAAAPEPGIGLLLAGGLLGLVGLARKRLLRAGCR